MKDLNRSQYKEYRTIVFVCYNKSIDERLRVDSNIVF